MTMKELHYFESAAELWRFMTVDGWRPVCYCRKETAEAIARGDDYIYTSQMEFVNSDTAVAGYRLFMHYSNGLVREVI